MSAEMDVQVFVGSTREGFKDLVARVLQDYEAYKFSYFKGIDSALDFNDANPDFTPRLAIIDGQDGTNLSSDWCQSIRMLYPHCPIVLLYSSQVPLDFAVVTKNGADVILNIIYDAEFIVDTALSLAPIQVCNKSLRRAHLTPIDTRDIGSDMNLNFDVFVHLPANKKSILVRKEGDTLDDKHLADFEKQKKNLYIKKTDLKKFFEYSRTRNTMLEKEKMSSPTEISFNLKSQLRNLNQQILNRKEMDFAQGKAFWEEYLQLVNQFEILKDRSSGEIVEILSRLSGSNRTYYGDSLNLATIASMFSQLLSWNQEKRLEMTIAGLFHNIGLANLPSSVSGKTRSQFTPEENASYEYYPEASVNSVKTKKIPLPQNSTVAILEHREYLNGTGFPHKIDKNTISEAGKLLSLAYHFMELVSLSDETPAVSPQRAIDLIQQEALSGEGRFDLIMSTTLASKWNMAIKKAA